MLGEGRVIAGWEKGLVGTCAGEKVLANSLLIEPFIPGIYKSCWSDEPQTSLATDNMIHDLFPSVLTQR